MEQDTDSDDDIQMPVPVKLPSNLVNLKHSDAEILFAEEKHTEIGDNPESYDKQPPIAVMTTKETDNVPSTS